MDKFATYFIILVTILCVISSGGCANMEEVKGKRTSAEVGDIVTYGEIRTLCWENYFEADTITVIMTPEIVMRRVFKDYSSNYVYTLDEDGNPLFVYRPVNKESKYVVTGYSEAKEELNRCQLVTKIEEYQEFHRPRINDDGIIEIDTFLNLAEAENAAFDVYFEDYSDCLTWIHQNVKMDLVDKKLWPEEYYLK